MFYYGWTSEHDWFTPPSTRLDRTFGLGAGLNQNLVQIKTELNQGIGSREPIPGSNRFFIAICSPWPPESCQMRWTTVCHLNQLNQFEPRRNCHWAGFEPELGQNRARAWKMIGQNDRAKNLHYHFALSFFRPGQIWTRFEPDLSQNWARIEPELSQNWAIIMAELCFEPRLSHNWARIEPELSRNYGWIMFWTTFEPELSHIYIKIEKW